MGNWRKEEGERGARKKMWNCINCCGNWKENCFFSLFLFMFIDKENFPRFSLPLITHWSVFLYSRVVVLFKAHFCTEMCCIFYRFRFCCVVLRVVMCWWFEIPLCTHFFEIRWIDIAFVGHEEFSWFKKFAHLTFWMS